MKIFFDLDGTLLDSRQRLFTLFCDLTEQNILDFDQYWDMKRSMVDHRTILSENLKYSDSKILKFQSDWLNQIEEIRYLDMDIPFTFTKNVLEKLTENNQLFVVTARQKRNGVDHQLSNLNLESYFQDILVTEGQKSKTQLIFDACGNLSENDIVVGDTGLDVLTAKELKCRSVAVLSGFRNRNILSSYNPDYIGENIKSLIEYV